MLLSWIHLTMYVSSSSSWQRVQYGIQKYNAHCQGLTHSTRLEGNGEKGQVDVLPAEGVQQSRSCMHCCRDSVPVLCHQDDPALQQQSCQQGHQALHWHMPQEASQRDPSVPGPIAKVWRDFQLDVLVRAAGIHSGLAKEGCTLPREVAAGYYSCLVC